MCARPTKEIIERTFAKDCVYEDPNLKCVRPRLAPCAAPALTRPFPLLPSDASGGTSWPLRCVFLPVPLSCARPNSSSSRAVVPPRASPQPRHALQPATDFLARPSSAPPAGQVLPPYAHALVHPPQADGDGPALGDGAGVHVGHRHDAGAPPSALQDLSAARTETDLVTLVQLVHSLVQLELDAEGKVKHMVDRWDGKELEQRMTVRRDPSRTAGPCEPLVPGLTPPLRLGPSAAQAPARKGDARDDQGPLTAGSTRSPSSCSTPFVDVDARRLSSRRRRRGRGRCAMMPPVRRCLTTTPLPPFDPSQSARVRSLRVHSPSTRAVSMPPPALSCRPLPRLWPARAHAPGAWGLAQGRPSELGGRSENRRGGSDQTGRAAHQASPSVSCC